MRNNTRIQLYIVGALILVVAFIFAGPEIKRYFGTRYADASLPDNLVTFAYIVDNQGRLHLVCSSRSFGARKRPGILTVLCATDMGFMALEASPDNLVISSFPLKFTTTLAPTGNGAGMVGPEG